MRETEDRVYAKVSYCVNDHQTIGAFIGQVLKETEQQLKDYTIYRTMINIEQYDGTILKVMFRWYVSKKDG